MTDVLQDREEDIAGPDAIFKAVKAGIKALLRHPFISPSVQDNFLTSLNSASLVEDDDFDAQAISTLFIDPDSKEGRNFISTTLLFLNGICIGNKGEQDRIFIRRSYIQRGLEGKAYSQGAVSTGVAILLLEELAHSVKTEYDIPLSEIPQDSLRIPHFNSREDLVRDLNAVREEGVALGRKQLDLGHDGTENDYEVSISGWSSTFADRETGITLMKYKTQHVLEEVRAGIILTIFDSIAFGKENEGASHTDQFLSGAKIIEDSYLRSNAHPREYEVVQLLRALFPNDTDLRKGIRNLLSVLTGSDIDGFLGGLTEENRRTFMKSANRIFNGYNSSRL